MIDKQKKQKIFIVIPVYNESPHIVSEVVISLLKKKYENVIIVDDGSNERFFIQHADVICLRHVINRGKGAAIKTGIEYAKKCGADCVVTIDGDGQHNDDDIAKLLEKIDDYDVILGVRTLNAKNMSFYKIMMNYIGNFFTWLFFGLWVSDSQSGLRAYSRKALYSIDTKSDRYEYDSEVIHEIYLKKLKYCEVPISVFYTEYACTKKTRQGFANGIKTVIRMISLS